MDILGTIVNAMRGLKKPRATSPVDGPPDIQDLIGQLGFGDPSSLPTAPDALPNAPMALPSGPKKTDTSRSDDLFKQIQDALGTLKTTPYPKPASTDVNPIEQALALWAGSKGPLALRTALPAPGLLADERAKTEDALNLNKYNATIGQAKGVLQYGVPAFNATLDRETALDGIEAKMKIAGDAQAAKDAIARAKDDTNLLKSIVGPDGKGYPSQLGIAQYFMQHYNLTQEAAFQSAHDYIVSELPGQGLKLQQARIDAHTQTEQDKITLKQREDDQKLVDSLDAPFSQRLAAAGRLQQAGLLPADVSTAEIVNQSTIHGQNMQSMTLEHQSRAALLDVEKHYKEGVLKGLPAEQADKHAKNMAQIDHWRNQDQVAAAGIDVKVREQTQKFLVERYSKTLESMGKDINSYTQDIVSFRDKYVKPDVNLVASIPTDAKGRAVKDSQGHSAEVNQAALDQANARLKANYAEIDKKLKNRQALLDAALDIRKKLTTDDLEKEVQDAMHVEQPKPEVRGAGERAPINPLSGPIGDGGADVNVPGIGKVHVKKKG